MRKVGIREEFVRTGGARVLENDKGKWKGLTTGLAKEYIKGSMAGLESGQPKRWKIEGIKEALEQRRLSF